MASATTKVWAIIAGGGTAGHVQPALAIGEALVEQGCRPESIHFLGARRGLEAQLLPRTQFAHTLLPGRGIPRRPGIAAAKAAFSIARAAVSGVILVARLRPAVVVSVGGFAAVPALVGAVVMRRPIVLIESNAVPGAANRFASRFATASAVAFPGTALRNPVVTGNPVRAAVVAVDRTETGRNAARDALGIPRERRVVAVLGGSLGARSINRAVEALAERWRDRGDLAVRHVVGSRDWDDSKPTAPETAMSPTRGLLYQRVEYEHDMPDVYAAADVVVARAGASTVAELATVAMPSVLVPLPNSPGDHQGANARTLESAGAAVVIPDHECDGERLGTVLEGLLESDTQLAVMSTAAATLAHPHAADEIASLVVASASRPW